MPSNSWLNGWVNGDLVSPTEFKKGVGSIFDTTLSVAAASIDTGAIIPATYGALRILFYARGDTAAASTPISLRINGVSTASYQYQQISASAATTTAAEGLATTSIVLGSIPAASATAGYFGTGEITIPFYAGTNAKGVEASIGYRTGNATGNGFTHRTSGWGPAATVNQLTLIVGAGNFAIGSRVTVYVMGA